MTLIPLLAAFYLLWLLYVLTTAFYRAWLNKRLTRFALVLASPFLLAMGVVDVAVNLTAASVLFAELPREWLVTTRLSRHLHDEGGWRRTLARSICHCMLDPFDPRGQHCA